MKEIVITKEQENQRLDKFLLKYLNTAKKSFIYKMLRKKRIKYNNKKAEGNEILKCEDRLQFYLSEETIDKFMEEKEVYEAKRHFGIVYEDDNILIVSKPAGLLTHPEKNTDRDTLIDQILYYLYQKGQYDASKEACFVPAVCNRLDRNTSGLVIAGKNLTAVQEINQAIAQHKVEKLYLTMVKGVITQKQELTAYIVKNEENNQVSVFENEHIGSKKIVTQYEPLKTAEEYTLLKVKLITGKSHQIRAHLKAIGHCVAGDRKYGEKEINDLLKQKYALSNQFLHAYMLVWKQKEGHLSYLYGKEWTAPLPVSLCNMTKEIFDWTNDKESSIIK